MDWKSSNAKIKMIFPLRKIPYKLKIFQWEVDVRKQTTYLPKNVHLITEVDQNWKDFLKILDYRNSGSRIMEFLFG